MKRTFATFCLPIGAGVLVSLLVRVNCSALPAVNRLFAEFKLICDTRIQFILASMRRLAIPPYGYNSVSGDRLSASHSKRPPPDGRARARCCCKNRLFWHPIWGKRDLKAPAAENINNGTRFHHRQFTQSTASRYLIRSGVNSIRFKPSAPLPQLVLDGTSASTTSDGSLPAWTTSMKMGVDEVENME